MCVLWCGVCVCGVCVWYVCVCGVVCVMTDVCFMVWGVCGGWCVLCMLYGVMCVCVCVVCVMSDVCFMVCVWGCGVCVCGVCHE